MLAKLEKKLSRNHIPNYQFLISSPFLISLILSLFWLSIDIHVILEPLVLNKFCTPALQISHIFCAHIFYTKASDVINFFCEIEKLVTGKKMQRKEQRKDEIISKVIPLYSLSLILKSRFRQLRINSIIRFFLNEKEEAPLII